MNRENKRKQYEKGYYKTHACNDSFTCKVCGRPVVPAGAGSDHRCRHCGKLSSNRIAADDNPMKLMSIAMKPLCSPPFPIERLEEMTALMGGEGRIK
ncbi:MAG: hypothetical protein GX234_00620 [Clostridiales bacterium]|nr:hypothetical protein [Clostridiales bacterium]